MAAIPLRIATCPIEDDKPDEPLVMEPQGSRVAAAVFVWIFALGVTGAAGWFVYRNFGKQNLGGVICPGIFLLIGIAIIIGAIYLTLQCFNPMPVVVLSQRFLYPGSEFEVSWFFRGNPKPIHKLTLTIEGTEKATYKQGTSTRSEEAIFYSNVILSSEDPNEIAKGFCVVTLPLQVMHTFRASKNEVFWKMKVAGVIKNWPDIDDAFPFSVLTPPITTGESE